MLRFRFNVSIDGNHELHRQTRLPNDWDEILGDIIWISLRLKFKSPASNFVRLRSLAPKLRFYPWVTWCSAAPEFISLKNKTNGIWLTFEIFCDSPCDYCFHIFRMMLKQSKPQFPHLILVTITCAIKYVDELELMKPSGRGFQFLQVRNLEYLKIPDWQGLPSQQQWK